MKTVLLSVATVLCTTFISAQDNTALLKDVEAKLNAGTVTVSSILTSPVYFSLHEHTDFRELIKKHASVGAVSIAPADEPGKKIKVKAQLKNTSGQPLPDVTIYFYQTDAKGWYAADRPHVGGNEGDRGHARLFGYAKTDKNGMFEIHTVKPSGYPQSDLPAHIHVEIQDVPGHRTLITEFLFDDDDRLTGSIREQALRSGFLNAKPQKATAPFDQLFNYTIELSSR